MTLAFQLPIGATQSTIDLSQVASLVNRRFYRQGINWAVAGFKVISPAGVTGSMSIAQLPNTWVMSNAWEKSFQTWQKMNREAMEETPSIRPKFLDFKIYADTTQHQAGFQGNLLPVDFAGQPYDRGEWFASKAVVPFGPASPGNTAEFEFVATGPNFPGASAVTGFNAVSLIEGYAASRSLPYSEDPNTPVDADDASGSTPENWMSAIFNTGTDQVSEVLESMVDENNIAPYPFEGDGTSVDTMYPNGANQAPTLQYHDSAIISGTTIGGITQLKGGNFPCGLVRIASNLDGENTLLQVNLVPGNHRGYLCEPMTEM